MSDRPGGSPLSGLSRAPRMERVPKPTGGWRSLVHLDPYDDLRFAVAVAGVAPFVERARPHESEAGRVSGWDRDAGIVLEPWHAARRRWRRDVRRLLSTSDVVVITDVRDCYGSITAGVVMNELRRSGVPEGAAADLRTWLGAFADAGVEGLPVGPAASAVLAEAVLARGDLALRRPAVAHVRWVDDVAIFADGRRPAMRALDALRRTWARVGLEANDAKTVVVDRDTAVALLRPRYRPGGSTLR